MFKVNRLIVFCCIVAMFGSCKRNDQFFDWENQYDLPAMILVISPYDCPPCRPGIQLEIMNLLESSGSIYPNKYIVTPGIRPLEIKKLMNDLHLKETNWNKLNSKRIFQTLNNVPQSIMGAKLYLVLNSTEIEIKRLKKQNTMTIFNRKKKLTSIF